ncbi:hypothetical protein TCAL_14710 [Tigriopus californicus]|uniref:Gustatory receptor n=1 Tax=Tigriopus californicus TaxID=6832 RepID=A0A553PGU1_TIGCA|nr:hypothetical protein TCAL_14710 [Tigriopus californicus]
MTSGPSNLTEFLHEGIELVEALALFDVIFGSVVALEVALCLIIELFGSYFGSTLSQAMQSQRLHVLCFALIFAFFGAQGFVRYYILTRNGQAMTNAMKDCHASLTKLDIWSLSLTPVQEKQMACILNRFSQPTAWSPMGLFDLSRASFVMIHSVMVTYLVILIQFKEVETGG